MGIKNKISILLNKYMTTFAFASAFAALLIYFIIMILFFHIGEYFRGIAISVMFIALYFFLKPIYKSILKTTTKSKNKI